MFKTLQWDLPALMLFIPALRYAEICGLTISGKPCCDFDTATSLHVQRDWFPDWDGSLYFIETFFYEEFFGCLDELEAQQSARLSL